jgi:hypothetical protein
MVYKEAELMRRLRCPLGRLGFPLSPAGVPCPPWLRRAHGPRAVRLATPRPCPAAPRRPAAGAEAAE